MINCPPCLYQAPHISGLTGEAFCFSIIDILNIHHSWYVRPRITNNDA